MDQPNISEIFNPTVKATDPSPDELKKTKSIQKLAMVFRDRKDDRSFYYLVNRITWGLRGYIYKFTQDNSATSDILSKTLENIYYKIDQFDPARGQFSTWMYRIARNNALKYKKECDGKIRTVNVDYEDLYDSTVVADTDSSAEGVSSPVDGEILDMKINGSTWKSYDKEHIIADFYDASVDSINYLPDNLRVVMFDRLVKQKKIEDIAYDNKMPITSVKNWLRRGRSELQNVIKERYSYLYNLYKELEA